MINNDCFIVVNGRVYASLDEVKDAMRGARNIILEDAAKVAEDCSVKVGSTYAAIYIAAAIRDLKDRTDG